MSNMTNNRFRHIKSSYPRYLREPSLAALGDQEMAMASEWRQIEAPEDSASENGCSTHLSLWRCQIDGDAADSSVSLRLHAIAYTIWWREHWVYAMFSSSSEQEHVSSLCQGWGCFPINLYTPFLLMWEHQRHHICLILISPEYYIANRAVPTNCKWVYISLANIPEYWLLKLERCISFWAASLVSAYHHWSRIPEPSNGSISATLILLKRNKNSPSTKQGYKISAATSYFHHSLIIHTKAPHFFEENQMTWIH